MYLSEGLKHQNLLTYKDKIKGCWFLFVSNCTVLLPCLQAWKQTVNIKACKLKNLFTALCFHSPLLLTLLIKNEINFFFFPLRRRATMSATSSQIIQQIMLIVIYITQDRNKAKCWQWVKDICRYSLLLLQRFLLVWIFSRECRYLGSFLQS